MTTVKMKYRTYVPYGWIAVEFCDLKFFGENEKIYERAWHKIKFAKYNEKEKQIYVYKEKIENINNKIKEIEDKIKNIRSEKWWRFWKTDEQKELEHECFELNKSRHICETNIEKCEKERFYSASELVSKANRFLRENGFVLTSSTKNGDECTTTTDVWEIK